MASPGSNIIRIGTGRKCTHNIWYEESDSLDTAEYEDKQDVGGRTTSKGKGKKARKGKKRGRKPKSKKTVEQEPQPGPSHLTTSCRIPVVECKDSMVVCRYKLPSETKREPERPFQVHWGENFLNTLLPSFHKEKGILKQPGAECKAQSRPRFSQTTVYYFEKANNTNLPSDGKIILNMENQHFYSNHLPVDVYEKQRAIRQKRNQAALAMDVENDETWKVHLTKKDEDIVLQTIEVPVELWEENATKNKVIPEKIKGCGCNVYCDPELCECNLAGKQCEVLKNDFPCGCQLDFCKNTHGRVAYNERYACNTFVSVSGTQKAREIKYGRVNKRKQLCPVRYRTS